MMQVPVQEGAFGWSTQGTLEHAVLVKGTVTALTTLVKALTVLQAQSHVPLFQAQPHTAG